MARRINAAIFPSFIRKMFRFRDSNSDISKRKMTQDIFKIEGLEERTMLSADPILGAGYAALVENSNHSTKTIEVIEKHQETQDLSRYANHPSNRVIDLNEFSNSSEAFSLIGEQTVDSSSSAVKMSRSFLAPELPTIINNSLRPLAFKAAITVDQSQAPDIILGAIEITDDRILTSTGGNITLGNNSSDDVTGDGAGGNDTLTLNARTGNISVKSTVGGSDALEGFTIVHTDATAGAINVTFDETFTTNGDVSITATG
ncbi:LEPR-XLL domain-containing protein, partial [bacterium]|nr:LEPR-XLL domain-containing protein [bacterium]